jgi:hypothetical protein
MSLLLIALNLCKNQDLQSLIAEITIESIHEEVDFSIPVGKEAW